MTELQYRDIVKLAKLLSVGFGMPVQILSTSVVFVLCTHYLMRSL